MLYIEEFQLFCFTHTSRGKQRGSQEECLVTLTITTCQVKHSNTKRFPGHEPERFSFAYRIHEKNAKEEVKTREQMERRIQAVLSLKTSITSNRVLCCAFHGDGDIAVVACFALTQGTSVFIAELRCGADRSLTKLLETGEYVSIGVSALDLSEQVLTSPVMEFILSTVQLFW